MEVLRRARGLAHLHVVAGAELQIALDAGAGVLRSLAFVTVRQQHHQTGEQAPLFFSGADELVDDNLRSIGEIAELRLPHHQRLGIVAAVTVFKTQHGGLGKLRVINLHPRLLRREMTERNVFVLVFHVDQSRVPVIEGAAPAVLAAEPDRSALHGE